MENLLKFNDSDAGQPDARLTDTPPPPYIVYILYILYPYLFYQLILSPFSSRKTYRGRGYFVFSERQKTYFSAYSRFRNTQKTFFMKITLKRASVVG